jgi:hypothetical protein
MTQLKRESAALMTGILGLVLRHLRVDLRMWQNT